MLTMDDISKMSETEQVLLTAMSRMPISIYQDEEKRKQWMNNNLLNADINNLSTLSNSPTFGISSDNYMHYAAEAVDEARKKYEGTMPVEQQMAIVDAYSQLAGKAPVSGAYGFDEAGGAVPINRFTEARRAANEDNGYRNWAANAGKSLSDVGLGVAGLVAPDWASQKSKELEQVYAPGGGVSGFLGRATGSALASVPAMFGGGAVGTAVLGTLAGSSGGQARMEIADKRRQGEEISATKEIIATAGNAALEFVFERFGLKVAKGFASALGVAGKELAEEAVKNGTKGVASKIGGIVKSSLKAAGAGAYEEAGTQVTQNIVKKLTYSPETGVFEGIGEATAQGALGPLLMGPLGAMGKIGKSSPVVTDRPLLGKGAIPMPAVQEDATGNTTSKKTASTVVESAVEEAMPFLTKVFKDQDIDNQTKVAIANDIKVAHELGEPFDPISIANKHLFPETSTVSDMTATQEQVSTPTNVISQIDTMVNEAVTPKATTVTDTETVDTADLDIQQQSPDLQSLRDTNSRLRAALKTAKFTESKSGIGSWLLNQRALTSLFKRGQRTNKPVSVIAFDMQNLKAANDAFGHNTTDEMIRMIGESMSEVLRTKQEQPGEQRRKKGIEKSVGDMFGLGTNARTGGDEFQTVLYDATTEQAEAVRKRIEDKVKEKLAAKNLDEVITTEGPWQIGLVGGVSTINPGDTKTMEQVVEEADNQSNVRKSQAKRDAGQNPELRYSEALIKNVTQKRDTAPQQEAKTTEETRQDEEDYDLIKPTPEAKARNESQAKELGIKYNGPQLDDEGYLIMDLFTDPENGSTFAVMPEENVTERLKEHRQNWAEGQKKAEPSPETTTEPAQNQVVNDEQTWIKAAAGEDIEFVEPQTNEERQASDFAKSMGLKVHFYKGGNNAGFSIGDTVAIASGSPTDLIWEAIGHEAAHSLGLDTKLLPKASQAELDNAKKEYLALAEKAYGKDSDRYKALVKDTAALEKESVAMLIGKVLRDPATRQELGKHGKSTLLNRIWKTVEKVINSVKGRSVFADSVIEQFDEMRGKAKKEAIEQEGPVKKTIKKEVTPEQLKADDLLAKGMEGLLSKEEADELFNVENQADWVRQAKQGDEVAKTKIHASQTGWMMNMAKKYTNQRATTEELMQEGIRVISEWMSGEARTSKADKKKGIKKVEGPRFNMFDPESETLYKALYGRVKAGMQKQAFIHQGGKLLKIKETSLEAVQEAAGTTLMEEKVESEDAIRDTNEAREIVTMYRNLSDKGFTRQEIQQKLSDQLGTEISDDAFDLIDKYSQGVRFMPKRDAEDFMGAFNKLMDETGISQWANPMIEPKSRKFQNVTDALINKKGQPVPETMESWEIEGKKIASDPEAASDIESRLRAGDILNKNENEAAKIIYRKKTAEALQSGDPQRLMDAIELGVGYRKGGTEAARTLVGRRDRSGKRAELKDYVSDMIVTPPEGVDVSSWVTEVQGVVRKWKQDGIDVTKKDDPAVISRVISDMGKLVPASKWSAVHEFYRNSLMSAPLTWMRNTLGGSYAIADIIMVKPIQRTIKGESSSKTLAAWSALVSPSTWGKALANAVETFKYEVSTYDLLAQGDTDWRKLEQYHRPAITGKGTRNMLKKISSPGVADIAGKTVEKAGRIIRLPMRINSAIDNIFKTVHAHTEVASYAVDRAKEMKLEPDTKEFKDFIEQQLADSGSYSWTQAVASGETQRVTFQEKSQTLEKLLLGLRESHPMIGFILPFVKTPVQLTKQAAISSPFGLAYMGYRAGQKAIGSKNYTKEEASRHAAQQLIAWGVMATLWGLTGDDDNEPMITGPISYGRKETAERQTKGNIRPPMSIRFAKDGRWYSYRNIEPFSTVLGSTVSLINSIKRWKKGDKKENIGKAWRETVGMISDQTYLRAVGDITKMVQDADTYTADKIALNFLSGWIPNFIDSAIRASDPIVREARAIGNEEEVPDYLTRLRRQGLADPTVAAPPKVDMWGRDIKTVGDRPLTVFATRFLMPFRPEDVKEDYRWKALAMLDKYNQKYPDSQKWFKEPSRFVEVVGPDARKIYESMNEDEYYLVNKMSGLIASDALADKKFNYNNPTEQDIKVLSSIIENSRTVARNTIRAARTAKYNNNINRYDELIGSMKTRIQLILDRQEKLND